MARRLTCGFELQSASVGLREYDATTGNISRSASPVHSGAQAMRTVAAGVASYTRTQYRTASTNKIFARVYLYIETMPVANTTILGLVDTGETNQGGGLRLNSTGTVNAIGGSSTAYATVGSASPALSLNQWYMLELSYDDADANNLLEARLDGVTFATGNGEDMAGASTCVTMGDIDASANGVFDFDDLSVNDNQGSDQSSWPGPEFIVHMVPTVAGDVNTFATQTGGTAGAANNFSRVNENPANDATSFNGSSTLNQEDLFNVTDPSFGDNDIVTVVEVHARFRNSTADATAAAKVEIEKTASGTKTQSADIKPNTTTWNMNTTAAPRNALIVTYRDPDGGPWTKAEITSMQIGYKLTTAPGTAGRRIDITKVWAVVGYVPKTPSRPPLVLSQAVNRGSTY